MQSAVQRAQFASRIGNVWDASIRKFASYLASIPWTHSATSLLTSPIDAKRSKVVTLFSMSAQTPFWPFWQSHQLPSEPRHKRFVEVSVEAEGRKVLLHHDDRFGSSWVVKFRDWLQVFRFGWFVNLKCSVMASESVRW